MTAATARRRAIRQDNRAARMWRQHRPEEARNAEACAMALRKVAARSARPEATKTWTWQDELATVALVVAAEACVLAASGAVLWGIVAVIGPK